MPGMNVVCDRVNPPHPTPSQVDMILRYCCRIPASIDKEGHLTDFVLILLQSIIQVTYKRDKCKYSKLSSVKNEPFSAESPSISTLTQ